MGGTRLTNIVQRRVIFIRKEFGRDYLLSENCKKDFGSYYTIRIEYPESEKIWGSIY